MKKAKLILAYLIVGIGIVAGLVAVGAFATGVYHAFTDCNSLAAEKAQGAVAFFGLLALGCGLTWALDTISKGKHER